MRKKRWILFLTLFFLLGCNHFFFPAKAPEMGKLFAPSLPPTSLALKPKIFPASPEKTPITDTDEIQAAQRVLQILKEILSAKNDNDPRIDTEFDNLSPTAKKLLQEEYRQIPSESRNRLGTIVFLLGKNLTADGDFDFLKSVFQEKECRSLQDCQSTDPQPALGTPVSLEYPQLVALKSLEYLLQQNSRHPQALNTLKVATESQHPLTQKKAALLKDKYLTHPG